MHQRWCTRGDEPEVMHQRRCTRGDAPVVMQHVNKRGVGTLPTRVECFPDLLGFFLDFCFIWIFYFFSSEFFLTHRIFSGCFDTSWSMIALSVPEIHCTRGFCDGRGGGIGYSSSWIPNYVPGDMQFVINWTLHKKLGETLTLKFCCRELYSCIRKLSLFYKLRSVVVFVEGTNTKLKTRLWKYALRNE